MRNFSSSRDNRSARTHASGKPHGTSQAFIPGPFWEAPRAPWDLPGLYRRAQGVAAGLAGVSGWGAGGGHRDGGPGMTWCAGGRGVALEAAGPGGVSGGDHTSLGGLAGGSGGTGCTGLVGGGLQDRGWRLPGWPGYTQPGSKLQFT